MTDEINEARSVASTHLRLGPRRYEDMQRMLPPHHMRMIDMAIANGDAVRIGSMVRLDNMRPKPDRIDEEVAGPAAPAILPSRDDERRAIAGAMDRGAVTVADIIDTGGIGARRTIDTLRTMNDDRLSFSNEDQAALTPYGRVLLLNGDAEAAVLLCIAAGVRGERSIQRIAGPEDEAALTAAIATLVGRGAISKNRRYYEVTDPRLQIAPGADGVPPADAIRAMLSG